MEPWKDLKTAKSCEIRRETCGFTQVAFQYAVESFPGYSGLEQPVYPPKHHVLRMQGVQDGIQHFEGISGGSLWISPPTGNSVSLLLLYIFISQSDDSHLLTIRFMERREMDKLSGNLTHAVWLIRGWKLAPTCPHEWELTGQGKMHRKGLPRPLKASTAADNWWGEDVRARRSRRSPLMLSSGQHRELPVRVTQLTVAVLLIYFCAFPSS